MVTFPNWRGGNQPVSVRDAVVVDSDPTWSFRSNPSTANTGGVTQSGFRTVVGFNERSPVAFYINADTGEFLSYAADEQLPDREAEAAMESGRHQVR
jgi:hypothetical protein